jgi:hypothetical protein
VSLNAASNDLRHFGRGAVTAVVEDEYFFHDRLHLSLEYSGRSGLHCHACLRGNL